MKKGLFILGWAVVAFLLGLTLFKKTDRIDLDILIRAADNLRGGHPVYNLSDELEHTKAPLITQFFIPLASLGRWWASRLWDVLTVVAFPALLWFLIEQLNLSFRGNRPALFLLTILILLNPWNTEVWTGQMNVLLLIGILLSVSKVPLPLAGLSLMFTLGVKPPYLLFVPWILRQSPSPKKLLLWTGLAAGLAAVVYGVSFGLPALVQDHLTWMRFLPESTLKHLHRDVNYGLPSQTGYIPGASAFWLLAGVVTAELLCRVVRDKYVSFSVIAPLVVICSPMAWFQNYTLCVGLVALVLSDISFERSWLARAWLSLAVVSFVLAFPLLNPEIHRHTSWAVPFYTWHRIPLRAIVLTLLVWGVYRTQRRAPSGEYVYPASPGGQRPFPL